MRDIPKAFQPPSVARREKFARHDVPVTYIAPLETTSPKFGAAFMKGCRGKAANVAGGLQEGDFASFCTPSTWPLLTAAQANGRNWYYGDHAFYRRGKYYRITKNAYQYVPTPHAMESATPTRFEAVGGQMVQPTWNTDGSTIVVCPNSDVYMAQHGIDAQAWVMSMMMTLARTTRRPILTRWKANAQRRPLYVDLHDAYAVVVYNSNAAVEALMAGIPVFVMCPWATTASMGRQDLSQIDDPYYPDRDYVKRFCWTLANHQWDMAEISSGRAWIDLQTVP